MLLAGRVEKSLLLSFKCINEDKESISLGSSIILQSVRSSSAKEYKPDNGGIRKWMESGLLQGNKMDKKSEFHESDGSHLDP